MNPHVRRRVALLSASLPLAVPVAFAGMGTDGAVGIASSPLVNNINGLMFDLGPNSNPPACATAGQGATFRGAVDLTTPGRIAEMKIAMAAYDSGAQLAVCGNGTCDVSAQSEDVKYLNINH